MEPYQEKYIQNCRAYQELTALDFLNWSSFDAAMARFRKAGLLAGENTALLQEELLPILDRLYGQEDGTLTALEEFADALTAGRQPLDLALSEQLHTALLNVYRRGGRRERIIKSLYKLGMVRYQTWNMLTGVDGPTAEQYTARMRYCFAEASGYLKYYREFDEETLGYILRSLANNYLGNFADWRERLNVVRHTMRVFTDERYRAAAPGLPWDRYMDSVHRQMLSVLPHSFPEGNLSPDEVEDVMDSALLIYERQLQQAAKENKAMEASRLLPYSRIEFSCGLISKEAFLSHMEDLMDAADPTRFDSDSSYRIISMPAFYVQYLLQMPELIPPRRQYIGQLYARMLDYIRTIPAGELSEATGLHMRQTLSVFLEQEGGLSYLELARSMMLWLAPELYAHGYAVGRMAQVLSRAVLSGEPGFFDDIPPVAALTSPEEKAAAMDGIAFTAGLLHDIGKLNFTSLYDHAGRQLLSSEAEALRLHTETAKRLQNYPSTQLYADAASGHHRWYDGSGGFPEDFRRQESPTRALVDVIALANFLDSEPENVKLPYHTVPFEDRIREALRQEGRRFSPLVTACLRDKAVLEELKALYETGRRKGYDDCYRRALGASGAPQPETPGTVVVPKGQ